MRHSFASRVAALLSGLLLLQLTLLSSGTLCRMHAERAAMANAAAESSGHVHTAQRSSSAESASTVPAGMPMGSCDMTGSCDGPWTPGGGCAAMASCGAIASAVPALETTTTVRPPHHVAIVAFAAMPPGPAFAPELPPPRA